MTDRTPPSSPSAWLSGRWIVIVLVLLGILAFFIYAWNQAQQAATQAELALATATANLAEAGQSQATAAAGQNAALAEAEAAQSTAQAAQATSTAAEASAQVNQAEALAEAASQAEAEVRQAEAYRLAAAALANLPGNPHQSLLLVTEAVSASLAAGAEVPSEIIGALRQVIEAKGLGSRLTAGHTGPVNDVAFSPDGSRLATAGDDGTIRLWDSQTGGQLLNLTHSPAGQPVYSVAFSPQGDRLASASFDQTAKIWDAASGQELLTLTGHTDWVVGVAFSLVASQTIATGSQDGTAILWDASTGQALLTLDSSAGGHTAAVNRLAFNPAGDRLATASDDGTIILWDTSSGEAVLKLEGHEGPVYDVAFNPEGDRLASAGIDGTIKLWASDTGEEIRTLPHNRAGWATSVAFNASGDWLASTGQDGRIVIWDAASGRERFNFSGATGPINHLAISALAGDEQLASASANGQVRLWQINDDEAMPLLPPLANHEGPVYGVAVTAEGDRLATSGGDGTVKIWQIEANKFNLLRTLTSTDTAALYALNFSPTGDSLAAAGEEGTVTIWETAGFSGGEIDPPLSLTGHTGPVYALAFNNEGSLLASAGEDGTTRLWDTLNGESGAVLPPSAENAGPVYSLAFNPAGELVAAAGLDGGVKVWDVTTNAQVAALPSSGIPVRALAFQPASPNAPAEAHPDLLVIGGDDGAVRLWTIRQSLRVLPGASAAIQALAFSPDQQRLAATAADGSVTVWSLVSGRVLSRLTSPPQAKAGFGLAFLPDGTLVTGDQTISPDSTAGTAWQWNIVADELLNLYSPAPISSLALQSTENNRLAAAGADGVARLWQIEPAEMGLWSASPSGNRGRLTGQFPADEEAILTSVTLKEDYLAAGSDTGSLWLWAASSGRLLASLTAHTGPVNSLLLRSSTEGDQLISAGQDDLVKVWTLSSTGRVADQPEFTLRGHSGDVTALALSLADNNLLATASHDGTARLWDLQQPDPEPLILSGHTGWLNDLAFNAAGDRLVTAGQDGTLRLWDVASGRELLRLTSPAGPDQPFKRLAFGLAGSAAAERLAALSEDNSVFVWSLASGPGNEAKFLFQLPTSLGSKLSSLTFDATGRALMTGGDDGLMRFYALEVEDLLSLGSTSTKGGSDTP